MQKSKTFRLINDAQLTDMIKKASLGQTVIVPSDFAAAHPDLLTHFSVIQSLTMPDFKDCTRTALDMVAAKP